MAKDRVASPSYRADGSEHGATTQTSGGEPNHVVIGSDEDVAYLKSLEDDAPAPAPVEAKAASRHPATEKTTSV